MLTQWLKASPKQWLIRLGILIVLTGLCAYPVYMSYTRGVAFYSVERHISWLNRKLGFYNPWQYRALCPLILEGAYQTLHWFDPGRPMEKAYELIFRRFRWTEHLLIYLLLWDYLKQLRIGKELRVVALMVACWTMGNAVLDSDYSLNTYMDVIVYLAAGVLILRRINWLWFLPLTLIAALNRETSIFLIFMPAILVWDWKRPFRLPKPIWFQVIACGLIFLGVYLGVRFYFGFRNYTPLPDSTVGPTMLFYNLFGKFANKAWMELIGTFGVMLPAAIWGWKYCDEPLRRWFLLIVPVWFVIHLMMAYAHEARVFLVPTFLLFLPMSLQLVQNRIQQRQQKDSAQLR